MKIFAKTFSVSLITLVSRVLGVLRDIIIATVFGANIYTDVFFLVFRVPDFFRKMFSEGIISSSFVPVFSKYFESQGRRKALEMANSAFILVSFLSVLFIITGILSAPLVIEFFVKGFPPASDEFYLTVLLSRIMLPYLICISLLAVCMGILNPMGSYKTSAFAPVVFNMVIIFFALEISSFFNPPVTALAVGVTTGGFVQLVLQMPFLLKKGIFNIKKIVIIHPGAVVFLKRLIPAITGASTFHINLLTATLLASLFSEGSISSLYYADRLVQLPMGLISVSFAIVSLPVLSKQIVHKNMKEASRILINGFKFNFFLIFPSMAGLLLLNESLVELFFFHGAFDLRAVNNTCLNLSYLISGLWAYSGTRLSVSFFHALSDTKTPLYVGLFVIITNIFMSVFLMSLFGFKGIVLSIAISGAVNFLILIIKLRKYILFSYKDIMISACRAVFVSVIMVFIIKILILQINSIVSFEIPVSINVAMSVITGILTYFGLHLLIKSPEIKMIKKELFAPIKN